MRIMIALYSERGRRCGGSEESKRGISGSFRIDTSPERTTPPHAPPLSFAPAQPPPPPPDEFFPPPPRTPPPPPPPPHSEPAGHRSLPRRAAGHELSPRHRLDARHEGLGDRNDDARDLAVNDEPLHDVLQDRLSRQRQELLRNVAAEAGARTGRWNDDENRHECRVPSAEQTESGADGSAPGTQHPALRPP